RPPSPSFPYTPLFRSLGELVRGESLDGTAGLDQAVAGGLLGERDAAADVAPVGSAIRSAGLLRAGVGLELPADGLQLADHPDQALGDGVVNLPGQARTLLVDAGLPCASQQFFLQGVVLLRRLLEGTQGPFAFG